MRRFPFIALLLVALLAIANVAAPQRVCADSESSTTSAVSQAATTELPNEPATRSKPVAPSRPAVSPKAPVKLNAKGGKEPIKIDAEREAEVIAFVREHHAELAKLLDRLKRSDRPEYQQALRDLSRANERLVMMQQRNPSRYHYDLEAWKLQSRIQLLAARLTMDDDPQIIAKLRALLVQQVELNRQRLIDERGKAVARAEELDKQIELVTARQKELVEERLQRLLQRPPRRSLSDTNSSKSNASETIDTTEIGGAAPAATRGE